MLKRLKLINQLIFFAISFFKREKTKTKIKKVIVKLFVDFFQQNILLLCNYCKECFLQFLKLLLFLKNVYINCPK